MRMSDESHITNIPYDINEEDVLVLDLDLTFINETSDHDGLLLLGERERERLYN